MQREVAEAGQLHILTGRQRGADGAKKRLDHRLAFPGRQATVSDR